MAKRIDNDGKYYTAADIDSIIATCPGGLPKEPLVVPQIDPEGNGESPRIVNRRTELIEQLDYAAARFSLERVWSAGPSPSEMEKRFRAIESSATILLKSLGLPDAGDPDKIPQAMLSILRRQAQLTGQRLNGFTNHPPIVWEIDGNSYTEYNGPAQLRDAIEGVKYLRNWSAEAKSYAAERVDKSRKRNKGDEPLSELIRDFSDIWEEIFGQSIGVSVGNPESKLAGRATGPMIRYIQACLAPLGESHSDEAIKARIQKIKGMVKPGFEET